MLPHILVFWGRHNWTPNGDDSNDDGGGGGGDGDDDDGDFVDAKGCVNLGIS